MYTILYREKQLEKSCISMIDTMLSVTMIGHIVSIIGCGHSSCTLFFMSCSMEFSRFLF